jgi:nicotinate phosphoribosyltransferase
LVAVCHEGNWLPAIKISETPEKTPNPGNKNVWRIYDRRGKASADLLSLESEDPRQVDQPGFKNRIVLRHPCDEAKLRSLEWSEISEIEPLLVEILSEGKLVYDLPSLEDMRRQRQADVTRLDPGVRRIMNPHIYHVSLTQPLYELKKQLIDSALEEEKKRTEEKRI